MTNIFFAVNCHSNKGFNYFMCISKGTDVESLGGIISNLTIPIQELRQHKYEICQQLYGVGSVKMLDTAERLRLAGTLKSKFNKMAVYQREHSDDDERAGVSYFRRGRASAMPGCR